MALAQDILTRIINVHWASRVYVIVRGTSYASPGDPDEDDDEPKSEVLATQSHDFGGGSAPLCGTLLECSATAGENFMKLETSGSNVLGLEPIRVFVCPKTDEVRDAWFDYILSGYEDGYGDDNGLPLKPFLWIIQTYSGDATVMNFRIKHGPHLIDEIEGIKNTMTQAYPTSGYTTWPHGNDGSTITTTGYLVEAYRLEKEDPITYSGKDQALWTTDTIQTASNSSFILKGLNFGTEPPLIAADVVYD